MQDLHDFYSCPADTLRGCSHFKMKSNTLLVIPNLDHTYGGGRAKMQQLRERLIFEMPH